MLYCMYMIEIYLEKKLKKEVKSCKCVYYRSVVSSCSEGKFYSKTCVFLDFFDRVNELLFSWMVPPHPARMQQEIISPTSGLLSHISRPGANGMEPDEPRGRRVNPPVWPSGLSSHPHTCTHTHMIKNRNSRGMRVQETGKKNVHMSGWVVDGVNGSGVRAHSLGQIIGRIIIDP